MPRARLLAVVVVLFSVSAFAQVEQGFPHSGPFVPQLTSAATPSEPWRIIPQNPDSSSWHDFMPVHLPDALVSQSQEDTTCLAIRSYVVARDGKNSDSTHPVSYSTCQPTSRYSVRSAEIRQGSPDQ
jgi:hypothetical protein